MATLDQRPSGAWRVRWRLDGEMQNLSFAEDEKDLAVRAKELAEAYRHSKDKIFIFCEITGVQAPDTPTGPGDPRTVVELFPLYQDSLLEMRPSTKRSDLSRFRTHVFPVIGSMPAAAVEFTHINNVMTRMKRTGLTKTTQDRVFATMKGFFSFIVRMRICPSNPVREINYKPLGLGKYEKGRKEEQNVYLTPEAYVLLRSKFCAADRLLLDFLVQTGARWSEAAATPVKALKMEKGLGPVLNIAWAWSENEDGSWYVGDPKGGMSRTVPLPDDLFARLQPVMSGRKLDALLFDLPLGRAAYYEMRYRWEKAVSAAMRCELHPPVPEGSQVAADELRGRKCGDNGGRNGKGQPCNQWVSPGWDRCKAHCGIPKDAESTCECWDEPAPLRLERRPTIHDLRHTFAAWMIEAGHSTHYIAELLGHSSSVITEKIYAGVLKRVRERARHTVSLAQYLPAA